VLGVNFVAAFLFRAKPIYISGRREAAAITSMEEVAAAVMVVVETVMMMALAVETTTIVEVTLAVGVVAAGVVADRRPD